jgi:hypothetical protein
MENKLLYEDNICNFSINKNKYIFKTNISDYDFKYEVIAYPHTPIILLKNKDKSLCFSIRGELEFPSNEDDDWKSFCYILMGYIVEHFNMNIQQYVFLINKAFKLNVSIEQRETIEPKPNIVLQEHRAFIYVLHYNKEEIQLANDFDISSKEIRSVIIKQIIKMLKKPKFSKEGI